MRDFEVHVEQSALDDLRDRLRRTRWPATPQGVSWELGTDQAYLRDLCGYWADGYDWRRHEAELNSWPQFLTEIDGEQMHVIHARSPVEGALPLVLLHGWPGSVVEFLAVIDALRDPVSHGGRESDAFHVVCPSLIGFGWSGPTKQVGWEPRLEARAVACLMAELGYDRYIAQGGDHGALISTQLGLLDPHVAGIHLNMVVAGPPAGADPLDGVSDTELVALAEFQEFMATGTGYVEIQSTRPHSLAYGLTDSPAGLAAWLVEKFRAWSDCDGDLESAIPRDVILADISTYWLSATIGSSVRRYQETRKAGLLGPAGEYVSTPTGVARFPKEMSRPPRRWVEACYNVVHWSELPRGGHFAALEQPQLWLEDLRLFARRFR